SGASCRRRFPSIHPHHRRLRFSAAAPPFAPRAGVTSMFDALSEYRVAIYLILAVAAVILIALWFRDRRRGWLYGVGVVALLAGAFALIDWGVETPSKQIKRNLQTMAAAVQRKDTKAIFDHV